MRRFHVSIVVAALAACHGGSPASAPVTPSVSSTPVATPATPTAPAPRVQRYAYIANGRSAGDAEISVAADGSISSHFTYNDRGRGPDTTTVVTLTADGLPRTIETTGVNYFKVPVHEQLSADGAGLRWESAAEHGSSPTAAAFFVPFQGPFDSGAILARALRKAPNHRLPLLPAGEAWIEDERPVKVTIGGQVRTITGVAIGGLGYLPQIVWLDEDGNFFGSVSTWSSLIVAGGEAAIPPLLAAELAYADQRAAKLAATLAKPAPTRLAITNVRLYDSETRKVREGVTILIDGDRIARVGPTRSTKIPLDHEVIDGRGKTVLPGMWDMHVHIGGSDGILHLAAGVTSVRDMGNEIDVLAGRVGRFEAGTEIGPRVFRAGFVDGPGKFAAPTGLVISTPEEARTAVTRYADLGYQQIKVYSSIDPALVPVIVEAAHARHLRVSGHIPQGMTARQAVEAGFDEVQHANFLFLNFLAKPEDDTRTPARFTVVAEGAAGMSLDSSEVKSFIELFKQRGTAIDPTLNAFESIFVDRQGEVAMAYRAILERLPSQVQRGVYAGGLPVPDGKDATYRASFRAMQELVKRMWKAGVQVLVGTDGEAGFAYQRELELYVDAGISPTDVLYMATLGAAKLMGQQKQLGSVAPGKLVDLVLVDGDPTKTISDVRRAELVITRGRMYRSDELYQALGVKPSR